MTRHSKNATAGPTYTYHEKKKDSALSGYGSKDVRLSKDAIKGFDCCSLSLQPCRNPVITPEGYLYEKEAILEYILHKKVENAKLLKQYEKQKTQKRKEHDELAEIEHKNKVEKFLKTEGKLVSSSLTTTSKESEASSSVSNMTGELGKKLPSFWVPALVPDNKEAAPMKKPDTTIYCPFSNKPIGMKDLIEVKFKLLEDKDDTRSFITKENRYVCAVSNDVLGNNVPCVVLRTSGSVVTQEVVDKIIKKDMIDPTNSKKLKESDIIPIQRGGTGFAGSGVNLISKKVGPAMIS